MLANGHAAAARLVDGSPFLAAVAGRADNPDRAPAGGSPDPGGARSQLAFDLAEVIAAAARPVLVVIDDAHQADTSSLRLLTELAPALRAMPAVVLVTARDGDQAWRGRLDERDALLRSGLVITLPPFAEDDVAGLVAGVTGAPPAPDLVSVITERSGGNPFLATELARQLADQDTSADAVRAAVPDSVRVITRARLAELAEPTRSVIESAAVLGARFRRDVLGRDRRPRAGCGRLPARRRRRVPGAGRGAAASARPGTRRGGAGPGRPPAGPCRGPRRARSRGGVIGCPAVAAGRADRARAGRPAPAGGGPHQAPDRRRPGDLAFDVHTHTVHIYAKCDVSTRAGLAMFAMRHGLAARTGPPAAATID